MKPEHADDWPELTRDFTRACNAEPGCLFFEWSRSVEEPTTYVLVEGFADDEAGKVHVESEHFQRATRELPQYLTATPQIVNTTVDGWSELGQALTPGAFGSVLRSVAHFDGAGAQQGLLVLLAWLAGGLALLALAALRRPTDETSDQTSDQTSDSASDQAADAAAVPTTAEARS